MSRNMSYSTKMTTNPLKGKKFTDLIVHEDQDFIVINKPPFVSTLQDRNDPQNILNPGKVFGAPASR